MAEVKSRGPGRRLQAPSWQQAGWSRSPRRVSSRSFGYLNRMGYRGQRFAVAIGGLSANLNDTNDAAMFEALAFYLAKVPRHGDDGRHDAVTSWIWSALDPGKYERRDSLLDKGFAVRWPIVDGLGGVPPRTVGLGLVPWYGR